MLRHRAGIAQATRQRGSSLKATLFDRFWELWGLSQDTITGSESLVPSVLSFLPSFKRHFVSRLPAVFIPGGPHLLPTPSYNEGFPLLGLGTPNLVLHQQAPDSLSTQRHPSYVPLRCGSQRRGRAPAPRAPRCAPGTAPAGVEFGSDGRAPARQSQPPGPRTPGGERHPNPRKPSGARRGRRRRVRSHRRSRRGPGSEGGGKGGKERR